MRSILAVLRILAFIIGSAILVPFAWVMREVTGSIYYCRYFHAMACRVFGIKIRIIGVPREYSDTPTVFVSNHLSYLDILVLGSHLYARFVAKAEVANWPVFGTFAKTQRTIFIERTKAALEGAGALIGTAIREKYNVILFAEGTSTDGRKAMPFKAGLLDLFYQGGIDAQLQPVAIVIESVGGKNPQDQAVRDLYAWWKLEDTLAPHLWAFAKAGGATIAVHYLPVLDPRQFADRKALANAATTAVANVLAA